MEQKNESRTDDGRTMIRMDEFEPFGSPVNSVVLIPCKSKKFKIGKHEYKESGVRIR